MSEKVYHEFPPIYHEGDTVLILGSMPSMKSREEKFYYAHPQNRFWKTLATIYHEEKPMTIDEKKSFLKRHHIALWDVIASCTIHGSSDSSIKDVVVNDIDIILRNCPIQKIFTVGKTATHLYYQYCYPKYKIESIYLPSTSPANCAVKEEELLKAFEKVNIEKNE